MRISDLSRRSGVPVGTIKYYLRERVLPPGTPTARNQAEYGDEHLRRLRLIRALTGLGRMDLASVRDLLPLIEHDRVPLRDLYEAANRAVLPERAPVADAGSLERIRAGVDAFIDRQGWRVASDAPGRDTFVQVVAALQSLGCQLDIDFFAPFAAAAQQVVLRELDLLPADGPVDRDAAAARTVLFEVALGALRRLAQEHHLALRQAGHRDGPGS
ncbi:MerR family transcriptional regulator [Dactylosporangium sp. NPDC005555]|uniref:MerR family transcriptional regulator n=1 Tax=Dactylosporangium sp. NPDC005555 TaxID=3154889 RepID=UPI0033B408FC